MKEDQKIRISRFDIAKVNNGYTINIQYSYPGVAFDYQTLIASSLEEVHSFVDEWFARVEK